jgi:hypothetical protein
VRQLLTEAAALGVTGAAIGVVLAWAALDALKAWIPTNSFASESVIRMNVPVLLFTRRLRS